MIDSAWTTLRSLQIGVAVVLLWTLQQLAVAAFLLLVGLVVSVSKAVVVVGFVLYEGVLKLRAVCSAGCASVRGSVRRLLPGRHPESR